MKTSVKALVIGETGSGKTRFCATFPKSYFMSTEPGGFETVESSGLISNVVKHDYYIPNPLEDIQDTFKRIDESIIEAHKMYKDGEIESFVFDNMTYHGENRWIYINKYQKQVSQKTGNVDTQAMYGILGRYLYEFTLTKLTSFPGNVVVTSHIKKESEEAMEGKANQDTDIVPNILGGFRDTAPGMFSLVMYLNNLGEGKDRKFIARVNKGKGQLAKNRYGLPDTVENISYETIYNAILKQKGEAEKSK